eukprot:gene8655-13385_t
MREPSGESAPVHVPRWYPYTVSSVNLLEQASRSLPSQHVQRHARRQSLVSRIASRHRLDVAEQRPQVPACIRKLAASVPVSPAASPKGKFNKYTKALAGRSEPLPADLRAGTSCFPRPSSASRWARSTERPQLATAAHSTPHDRRCPSCSVVSRAYAKAKANALTTDPCTSELCQTTPHPSGDTQSRHPRPGLASPKRARRESRSQGAPSAKLANRKRPPPLLGTGAEVVGKPVFLTALRLGTEPPETPGSPGGGFPEFAGTDPTLGNDSLSSLTIGMNLAQRDRYEQIFASPILSTAGGGTELSAEATGIAQGALQQDLDTWSGLVTVWKTEGASAVAIPKASGSGGEGDPPRRAVAPDVVRTKAKKAKSKKRSKGKPLANHNESPEQSGGTSSDVRSRKSHSRASAGLGDERKAHRGNLQQQQLQKRSSDPVRRPAFAGASHTVPAKSKAKAFFTLLFDDTRDTSEREHRLHRHENVLRRKGEIDRLFFDTMSSRAGDQASDCQKRLRPRTGESEAHSRVEPIRSPVVNYHPFDNEEAAKKLNELLGAFAQGDVDDDDDYY